MTIRITIINMVYDQYWKSRVSYWFYWFLLAITMGFTKPWFSQANHAVESWAGWESVLPALVSGNSRRLQRWMGTCDLFAGGDAWDGAGWEAANGVMVKNLFKLCGDFRRGSLKVMDGLLLWMVTIGSFWGGSLFSETLMWVMWLFSWWVMRIMIEPVVWTPGYEKSALCPQALKMGYGQFEWWLLCHIPHWKKKFLRVYP